MKTNYRAIPREVIARTLENTEKSVQEMILLLYYISIRTSRVVSIQIYPEETRKIEPHKPKITATFSASHEDGQFYPSLYPGDTLVFDPNTLKIEVYYQSAKPREGTRFSKYYEAIPEAKETPKEAPKEAPKTDKAKPKRVQDQTKEALKERAKRVEASKSRMKRLVKTVLSSKAKAVFKNLTSNKDVILEIIDLAGPGGLRPIEIINLARLIHLPQHGAVVNKASIAYYLKQLIKAKEILKYRSYEEKVSLYVSVYKWKCSDQNSGKVCDN